MPTNCGNSFASYCGYFKCWTWGRASGLLNRKLARNDLFRLERAKSDAASECTAHQARALWNANSSATLRATEKIFSRGTCPEFRLVYFDLSPANASIASRYSVLWLLGTAKKKYNSGVEFHFLPVTFSSAATFLSGFHVSFTRWNFRESTKNTEEFRRKRVQTQWLLTSSY